MATEEKGFDDVIPTVTLARLYAKQGLLKEAAVVYRALLDMEPGQEALESALRDIEGRLRGKKKRSGSAAAEAVLARLEQWHHVVCSRKTALVQQTEIKGRVLVVQGPADMASSGLSAGEESAENPTPQEIARCIRNAAAGSGMVADVLWADSEDALIQKLQEATKGYDVLIIDPGQSGGATTALRDALAVLDMPIIEVHPLNVFCGEPSGNSGIADVTTAHLAGFGKQGYAMAVGAAAKMTGKALEAKAHDVKHEP
jgi:3-dehydroquinate dehydratase-2